MKRHRIHRRTAATIIAAGVLSAFPFVPALGQQPHASPSGVDAQVNGNDEFYLSDPVYIFADQGGVGSTSASASDLSNGTGGSAASSLATGTLHAASTSVGVGQVSPTNPQSYNTGSYTYSNATLYDTVTLFNQTSGDETVTYSLTAQGAVSDNAGASISYLIVPASQVDFGFDFDPHNITQVPVPGDSLTIDGSFTAATGMSQEYIFLQLNTAANSSDGVGGASDFSHTLQFQWSLPAGVTYTSASGVFLSSAAAPEPGPGVCFAAGILGLLLLRVCRRIRA